ncbi:MAG TPA: Lrp/AsnC family transcriptional regulator [Longimicrobiaceae bacterium]|nr:Lrp/AsnC family transcriptional regulator [Longimicrobiaceae bacterium]
MNTGSRLDDIDLKLLEMLQGHGRSSQHDLALSVGLSSPAVGERLRKLEERGIIRRFTAVLDPKMLGRDVTAFIAVGIAGSSYYGEFRRRVGEHPEVLECHSITGQGSHLLKIRTESTSTLEALLAEIQSWPGVQWTTTSIVLSTVKETSSLELGHRTSPENAVTLEEGRD